MMGEIHAFSHGLHFPFAVMTIEFGHDHGRIVAAATDGVAGDFRPAVVHQTAVGIGHLIEVLSAVAADGKDKIVYLGGDVGQRDVDDLVVPLSVTGQIIAGVGDAAILALELTEIDDVQRLLVRREQYAGGVKVDVAPAA